jgi:hypothetical protein
MFCAPGLDFGGTEGVGFRFHVLRSRTRFRRYRGRRVPFSCFALLDSISTVSMTSGPRFLFCAPGLIFDGTEGAGSRFLILRSRPVFSGIERIGSHFHVFRSHTHFRRYRRRQVPFSCFPLPDSFRQYRGSRVLFSCFALSDPFSAVQRQVPFSCFALSDSFSAVPSAMGDVFMFCAPGPLFGGTDDAGSRFYV